MEGEQPKSSSERKQNIYHEFDELSGFRDLKAMQ